MVKATEKTKKQGKLSEQACSSNLEDIIASYESDKPKLLSILNHLPCFVYLQAPDHTIKYANEAFIKLFGKPNGKPCYEIVQNRTIPCEDCPTLRVYETKKPQIWEWVRSNGRVYEIHDYPFTDVDGTKLVIELGIDITQRKQQEEELKRAVALNQSIIESTTDGILVVDRDGKVITYNKKFQELWRMPDSLASTHDDKKMIDFVTEQLEDPEAFTEKVNELYDHPEITSFDTLKFKDGKVFERYSQAQMLGEKIVGRVWSFRDVSLQKRLKESLRKSKERFHSHVDNLSLIAVGLDMKGTVIYANKALCKLLGLDKKEILGRNWTEEFIPERYRLEIMEVSEREIESELHPNYENPVLLPNGEERLIRWNNTVLRDSDGKPYETMSVGEDITEIRSTQEALRESEERFKLALEAVEEGVWDWNLVTNEIYFSPRWEALYGYKPGEVEPHFRALEKIVHPEDEKLVMQAFKDHAVGRTDSYHVEHRVKTKSGKWVWTLGRGKIVERDRQGKPLRMVGTARDITGRKQAEELLKKNKEDLERMFNLSGYLACIVDIKSGFFQKVSPAFTETLGFSSEELRSKSLFDFIHLDDREKTADIIKEELLKGTAVVNFENRYRCKDGSYKWLAWSARPVVGEGITFAIAYDITNRKKAEQKLLFNKDIIRSSSSAIASCDLDGRMNFANPAFLEAWGFSNTRDFEGRHFSELWEVKDRLDEIMQTLKNKGKWFGEVKAKRKDGKLFDVQVSAATVYDEKGNPVSLMSTSIDVTTRKKAEQKLLESENLFRNYFELGQVGMAITSPDQKWLKINNRLSEILGYSKEELKKMTWTELTHPDDLESDLVQFNKVLSGEIDRYEIDKRFIHKSGKIVDVSLTVSCQRNLDGTVNFIIASLQDITERKHAEENLKESNERINLLLNSTGEAIYGLDLNGNCTFVNSSCLRILDYKDEHQLIGKNMHDLIHHTRKDGTPYHEEDCKIYMAFREGKGTRVDDEVLWRSNGTSFSAEYQSFPIFGNGNIIGSVVTFIDITERKKAEDQIKASLEEKELLLREIHHRVKNNMQVISSLIHLQSGYVKDKKDLRLFNETQNQIKAMSLIHEKLYQSKSLAIIDFNEYIKSISNDMLRFYKVDVNKIVLEIDAEDVGIGIDIANPCGLILNELLSNCLKYAFPEGRKGKIRIAMRLLKEDEVELIVADNGISMAEDLDIRNTKSLGMQLVAGLAEGQLGGKIELNRKNGTEFRITFRNKTKVK